MASGYGYSYYLVVQVSGIWISQLNLHLLILQSFSFLVKDAQQDVAGDRLKA